MRKKQLSDLVVLVSFVLFWSLRFTTGLSHQVNLMSCHTSSHQNMYIRSEVPMFMAPFVEGAVVNSGGLHSNDQGSVENYLFAKETTRPGAHFDGSNILGMRGYFLSIHERLLYSPNQIVRSLWRGVYFTTTSLPPNFDCLVIVDGEILAPLEIRGSLSKLE